MKLQKLLFGVGFFSVLSLFGWIGVLFLVDPDSYGMPGMVLFLGTAFSFLSGVFALILVTLARRFLGDAGAEESFGMFFRQGFLLASFVIGLLLLSRFGMLAWWTGALTFVAVLLIELSVRNMSDMNGTGNDTE
ncbi:MAG: hypothetical protein HGA31_05895 [Candidatus Moranbacteria bacterium]|nr:hypothetical protein [Candidatus Moranbacteria bacterium]